MILNLMNMHNVTCVVKMGGFIPLLFLIFFFKKTIDGYFDGCYNNICKEVRNVRDWEKKINEFSNVVVALTGLAMEIGSLFAVIKYIVLPIFQ